MTVANKVVAVVGMAALRLFALVLVLFATTALARFKGEPDAQPGGG